MADWGQILAHGWPGEAWSFSASNLPCDDQNDWDGRLAWDAGNALPKPTLAEAEAARADTDAALATAARQRRWQDELTAREDKLLQALEVLTNAIDDLQAKIRGNALSAPLDAAAQNQIDTLKTRLAQIRAL